jgi:small subunit ribosomal protein S11
MANAKRSIKSSRRKKNIKLVTWVLYVRTTFNNTLITLADEKGNKISGYGTWVMWFKWAKQSTPYAAEMIAKAILTEAKDSFGLKSIGIKFKWLWLGRDGVFNAINTLSDIDITYIQETTPLQFGWCKGKRPKRN